MTPSRVLILGGSSEASTMARCLVGDERFAPILSLAGRTRSPALPPIPHRIGGFGGVDGLVRELAERRIDLLVCATHPFADQMRRHAAEAARRNGTPLLIVDRASWHPAVGDRWFLVPDMSAAADALGRAPQRVLLTVGRKDLSPFVEASQHTYVVRSIDPPQPDRLPTRATVISDRPPFSEADERRLLETLRIETIVTKNSGGADTAAKLMAARDLDVTVVMVERPGPIDLGGLDATCVSDAAGALAWLAARHEAASIALRL